MWGSTRGTVVPGQPIELFVRNLIMTEDTKQTILLGDKAVSAIGTQFSPPRCSLSTQGTKFVQVEWAEYPTDNPPVIEWFVGMNIPTSANDMDSMKNRIIATLHLTITGRSGNDTSALLARRKVRPSVSDQSSDISIISRQVKRRL